MPKVLVSPDWTTEERSAVMALVDDAIWWTEIGLKDARRTILWRSPYIIGLEAKIGDLRVQRAFLDGAPPAALELNRKNFSEFVA